MMLMKCDKKQFEKEPFPNFAKPTEIDYFSVFGENRTVVKDKSQLKIYNPPFDEHFSFNLNEGFDKFSNSENSKELLDCFLKWILLLKSNLDEAKIGKKPNLKEILFNVDFVSWRGLLTKIAATPYQLKEGWIVCVTKFENVCFMCEFETDEKKQQIENCSDYEKLMQFWGHRFENYVTKTSNGVSCQNDSVNCKEQFCSVVRTKLDDHRLLFGGETDCQNPNTGEYMELKTSRILETPKQHDNFRRFKLLKWWIQSFLIGINEIVCGFRNDNGIVQNMQKFSVNEIPKLCNEARFWSGALCFNFLKEFLTVVKENVTKNDPNVVYKFEFDPKTQKIYFENANFDKFTFIRPWFVNEFSTVD